MTSDLSATASTSPQTPAEDALPVRQRATAAETRLTPAEWGLLSVLTLIQFSVTIDFIIIAPLGPQLMRVFGIGTAQFGWTVAAYAFGAGLSSFSAAFFWIVLIASAPCWCSSPVSRSVRFAARWHQGTMRCSQPDS